MLPKAEVGFRGKGQQNLPAMPGVIGAELHPRARQVPHGSASAGKAVDSSQVASLRSFLTILRTNTSRIKR